MAILEDILAELKSINQAIKELPMAMSKVVLQFKVVAQNAAPQYVGEAVLGTLIVGQPVVLKIMDPDGDAVTASLGLPEDQYTLEKANDGTQNYIFTPLVPMVGPSDGLLSVELTMDDGKPE